MGSSLLCTAFTHTGYWTKATLQRGKGRIWSFTCGWCTTGMIKSCAAVERYVLRIGPTGTTCTSLLSRFGNPYTSTIWYSLFMQPWVYTWVLCRLPCCCVRVHVLRYGSTWSTSIQRGGTTPRNVLMVEYLAWTSALPLSTAEVLRSIFSTQEHTTWIIAHTIVLSPTWVISLL